MQTKDEELVAAARRLLENDDMRLLITNFLSNLQQEVMDSSEDKDVLKLHAQHAAVRDFAEYVQMVGEKPLR